MTGRISNIQRFSLGDGPGIRTTVFFKGCPLHCAWCHNPETIRPQPEIMFHKTLCVNCGLCASVCANDAHTVSDGIHIFERSKCKVCGECAKICPRSALEIDSSVYSVDSVMKIVTEDIDFYKESGGGVTLSGGEPLSQPEFCAEIAKKCHESGISVLIDTSAQAEFAVFEALLDYADEYYVDLKAATEDDYKKMTGGRLFPVCDNIKKLCAAGKNVTVRIPVIPGHNYDVDYMKKMASVLAGTGAKRVDLLPFHSLCSEKYAALGKKYAYDGIKSLSKEDLVPLVDAFEGFDVKITH